MGQSPRIAAVILCSVLLAPAGRSQEETAPPTPAQLASMERLRPLVEAIWLDVRTPPKGEEERPRYFWDITDKLVALGPDVVPFVTSELDLMDPETFHFCAYALGRLGGPEAEAALRKAVRAANARGGNFGTACKRFALYGLALLGAPDVLDLMQTGVPLPGAEMVPDLPLSTHLALLVGPPAAPSLEKQLDAFKSDPAAVPSFDATLRGLGRVGDASVLPKLEPLLTNLAPEVRALTADTISRLAEPKSCDKLLAALSSPDQKERRMAARAFERWKPDPCYRAMIGRLEVETDLGVRGPLYNAIESMGGEASLEVFRTYLHTPIPFDQPQVIEAIGRIGSTKGLNMLRSLLTDENILTVVRALQAMGAIGGQGATDTLMATTSDSRRMISWSARNVLTDMGVKKVAPRVASSMLEIVREPVGDLSLRTPIAEWGDALVKLGYTEPAEDLKAAAAVQPDPPIKDALESCVRRLQLLAANGEGVAAWETAATSTFPDVRRLAYQRLAQIGSAASVRAIGKRLASTDLSPEDRAAILIAIGDARTEGASDLVARHLSDPAYDAWDLRETRAAAAYAARRLGGDRMAKALRESAVRRDGRDWATLVYLAILDKGASLPTLKDLRVRRLRYPEALFGHQEIEIDGIISDLSGGRDLKRFDVAPEALFAE